MLDLFQIIWRLIDATFAVWFLKFCCNVTYFLTKLNNARWSFFAVKRAGNDKQVVCSLLFCGDTSDLKNHQKGICILIYLLHWKYVHTWSIQIKIETCLEVKKTLLNKSMDKIPVCQYEYRAILTIAWTIGGMLPSSSQILTLISFNSKRRMVGSVLKQLYRIQALVKILYNNFYVKKN